MRIIIASTLAWPKTVGGGEVHTWQLAREFHARGHQVSLLTVVAERAPKVSAKRELVEGIQFDYLQMPELESPYDRDPAIERWGVEWLREEAPDVLHLFVFSGLLGLLPAARRLGIPVIYTALEFSYFCRRYTLQFENRIPCALHRRGRECESCVAQSFSKLQRLLAWAARMSLTLKAEATLRARLNHWLGANYFPAWGQRRVTQLIEAQRRQFTKDLAAVIAPSTLMRDFFVAQGAEPSRVHFVHYGTDVRPAVSRPGRGETRLRLGFVGRPDRAKGIHVLCEAVRRLPHELDFAVAIHSAIRDDPSNYAEEVRQLAAGDPRVRLLGPVSREGLPVALAEVDALVVPSIWYENSPIVISEALACGVPVVCSDSPGNADLVQDGVNGLMFKLGDAGGLARCIERLVREPALRTELRQGVRPPPTTGEVASQLLALYAALPRPHWEPSSAAC